VTRRSTADRGKPALTRQETIEATSTAFEPAVMES
jgi:hypothetical protein